MRGTDGHDKHIGRYYRITPAHAGNRQRAELPPSFFKDHPRACGEQAAPVALLPLRLGSPPRMRGTAHNLIFNTADDGITPAHAGNRQQNNQIQRLRRDHPRACGEQTDGTDR